MLAWRKPQCPRTGEGSRAPKPDAAFSNAPYWNFNDDKLKFNSNDVDNPNPNYGSASAALPVCGCPAKAPPI